MLDNVTNILAISQNFPSKQCLLMFSNNGNIGILLDSDRRLNFRFEIGRSYLFYAVHSKIYLIYSNGQALACGPFEGY